MKLWGRSLLLLLLAQCGQEAGAGGMGEQEIPEEKGQEEEPGNAEIQEQELQAVLNSSLLQLLAKINLLQNRQCSTADGAEM